MARRAGLIDALKAEGKTPIQLDLGDFVSSEDVVGEAKNEFIFGIMEEMGTVAATFGERELTEWAQTERFMSRNTIPFVSANLKFIKEGVATPLAEPFIVRTIDDVPIAFVGVIGSSEFTSASLPDDMEIIFEDHLDALPGIIAEAREKAELVVLLSHMDGRSTEKLVQSMPGIDLALVGHRARSDRHPRQVGDVIINESGIRGQWAGVSRLIISTDGRILDWGGDNVPLDTAVNLNADIDKRVENLNTELKLIRQESAKLSSANRDQADNRTRYLGGENCQRCHVKQYDHWKETPHAHAFASLMDEGKAEDKKCLACHVTGIDHPSGFSASKTDPDFRNVQCESCHGFGTDHVRGPEAPKVTEALCVKCHDSKNSPNFNYTEYLKAVLHK
ncbi:MAG: hypothetical protein KJ927_05835 [Candidatus Eisenbacteria bacterium]|nr:hypothetical protein [Candidatus Eisenbacteria bacterium]